MEITIHPGITFSQNCIDMNVVKHYTDLLKLARLVEADGELEKAAELYEQAIEQEPIEALPYSRLMIIYRKFKQPKDELRVIDKGLEVFKSFYDKRQEPFTGKNKVGQLSKALLKTISGSNTKKSYTLYPEPIPKWTLRRKAVEKKL